MVWITREVFREPTAELIHPGQELFSNDEGFADREGVVLVPSETPPGTYRIGSSENDVRIEISE